MSLSPGAIYAFAEVGFGILDAVLEASKELTPAERAALLVKLNTRIDATYAKLEARRPLTPADQVAQP